MAKGRHSTGRHRRLGGHLPQTAPWIRHCIKLIHMAASLRAIRAVYSAGLTTVANLAIATGPALLRARGLDKSYLRYIIAY